MRFEALLLLASATLGPALAALPPAILPEGVGVNIHFTRGHEQDLDLIAAAGCKWIRMDFGWAATEGTHGQYDWSAYDELTANLAQRGLGAIYILDYSNPLYEETVASKNPITGREQRDTASPQHSESVAGFANWAAASARHFAGKEIIWEIWNEPNISFWKPKPDVQQYIALAAATCKAVREADPSATMIGPATSGLPQDFLEAFFKSGILAELNAVSVHPYRNYSKSPESVMEDYDRLRALIAQYAPAEKKALPILSGEWGYASHSGGVSLETQAAYLVRQQLINLLAGVPLSIWYDWKNDGTDPAEREHHFGTVTYDLQPKPAYIALRTLTRELPGYKVARRRKTNNDEDYVLFCTTEKGAPKLAVWTRGAPHTVSLPVTGSVSPAAAIYIDGRRVEVQADAGRIVLPLEAAPAFISLGSNPVFE